MDSKRPPVTEAAGAPQSETYKLEFDLEHQLAASFPNPGDADRIHQLFRDDLGRDNLGVGPP